MQSPRDFVEVCRGPAEAVQGVQGVLAHRPKTGLNSHRGTIRALLGSPVVPLLRFFLFEVLLIKPKSRKEGTLII